MWPPTFVVELAFTTIAMAFQRIRALDAAFDVAVARKRRLLVRGNRVDVGRAETPGGVQRRGAQAVGELFQQLRRAFRPLVLQRQLKHGLQRLGPLVAVAAAGGAAPHRGNGNRKFLFCELSMCYSFFS